MRVVRRDPTITELHVRAGMQGEETLQVRLSEGGRPVITARGTGKPDIVRWYEWKELEEFAQVLLEFAAQERREE